MTIKTYTVNVAGSINGGVPLAAGFVIKVTGVRVSDRTDKWNIQFDVCTFQDANTTTPLENDIFYGSNPGSYEVNEDELPTTNIVGIVEEFVEPYLDLKYGL